MFGKLPSVTSLDVSSIHSINGAKIDTLYNVVDSYNFLLLQEPSFKTLVSKLTNLREFYLDGVNILEDNRAGAELLEKFVPRL